MADTKSKEDFVYCPHKSFQEHTYERRLWLMSHFYLDEMVYGEIGVNPNAKAKSQNHNHCNHFDNAVKTLPVLPRCINDLQDNWNVITSPHPLDFEDLYERIKKLIGDISGVGPVTLYDIALNIGINLYPKVLPKHYVYIHENVKEAAEGLLDQKLRNETRIDISRIINVIPALEEMSAMDIEDLLCVYDEEFKSLPKGTFNRKMLEKMPCRAILNKFGLLGCPFKKGEFVCPRVKQCKLASSKEMGKTETITKQNI